MNLALLTLVLAGTWVTAQQPVRTIRIEGGDRDDRALARAALGLREGLPADQAALDLGLAAIARTSRFIAVEGRLEEGVATVRLRPLRPLAKVEWAGGPPAKALRNLLPTLPPGGRWGDLRLEAWRQEAALRLREEGWPSAEVRLARLEEGARLRVELLLGAASRVRSVTVQGDPGGVSERKLLGWAGLKAGQTLWSAALSRRIHQSLRERYQKAKRLEARVEALWDSAEGRVTLKVESGPKVRLKLAGASVGGFLSTERALGEILPVTRAAAYDPRLLEEGARRLRRHFRELGYLDVTVEAERQTRGADEVVYLHRVVRGARHALGRLRFEGHAEVPSDELESLATAPFRRLLGRVWVSASVQRTLEERVRNHYRQMGFADVRVHSELLAAEGQRRDLKVTVREGGRRWLRELELELPPGSALDPRPALTLWLQDRPTAGPDHPSDRLHLRGLSGRVEALPASPGGGPRFRLRASGPVPFVRADLAQVVSGLRQMLVAAGSERPLVRFEDDERGERLLIRIPEQSFDAFRRMVVRDLDGTRAEAVLREYPREVGDAFDPGELDKALGRASDLGAFERLDLQPLRETPGQEEKGWARGDLELKAKARSPWTFSSGFAYDRAQGYRFLEGVQWNNLGGMGRTLDLSLRAGDSTLRSKALKEAFPTGDLNRSLDSYTLAYTDPWFWPGSLDRLLSPRTRFRLEGAYLEEAQPAFFARRRRALAGLEWRIGERQTVQLGYRFERADLGANRDSEGNDLISPEDLERYARTPLRSVISAPRLTLTVDRRDKATDPTRGTAFEGMVELGLQALGTSSNASFIRVDLRHQWNWPLGFQASAGVLSANLRLGAARPTANSAQELPLTERFFGGGPFSVRGVEPGFLGPVAYLPKLDPVTHTVSATELQLTPLGGQALATASVEYRFPLPWIGQTLWGEVFVDAGQVYERLKGPFPPWRVTPGLGVILKVGFPIKVEYAADLKRILGRPRTDQERQTQLGTLLISAGFQY